jgi:signal transduction histidine kinase
MNETHTSLLASEEQLRLEREVVEISEIERRRMGREFHDGLGQKLTGVSLVASILAEKLDQRGVPEAADARRLLKLVQEAVRDARSLARGLFPAALRDRGLEEALEDLLTQIRDTSGVQAKLHIAAWEPLSDTSASTHVFRIVQEAVNNAVKHSSCTEVQVTLSMQNGSRHVLISDNGTGLTVDSESGSGMGIRLMRHRAQLLGGGVTIGVGSAGGCDVELVFEP